MGGGRRRRHGRSRRALSQEELSSVHWCRGRGSSAEEEGRTGRGWGSVKHCTGDPGAIVGVEGGGSESDGTADHGDAATRGLSCGEGRRSRGSGSGWMHERIKCCLSPWR